MADYREGYKARICFDYEISPPRLLSITIANPQPSDVPVEIQGKNQKWERFIAPANSAATKYPVESSHYRVTLGEDGQLDEAPNLRTL